MNLGKKNENTFLKGYGRITDKGSLWTNFSTYLRNKLGISKRQYWNNLKELLINPSIICSNNNKGTKILIINHYFDQDINAIADANTKDSILILPHRAFRDLAAINLPQKIMMNWMKYYYLPESESYRNAYRKDLKEMLNILMKQFPFDVVVSTSVILCWIRELIPEIQSRGIPFVVIDKEGTVSPHYFNKLADNFRSNKYIICDHILVWGQRQKTFWELAGFPSKNIHIVGQQRSDFWTKTQVWKSKSELGLDPQKRLFLFFSFDKDAYIPIDLYQKGEVRWDDLFRECHRTVLDVAKNHLDWEIVIKAHPQQHNIDDVEKMVNEYSLKNVKLLTGSGIANHLIVNAEVISGFQTTSMIESMIVSPRPIIYPFWGDAPKWSEEILPFHKSRALTVAHSKEEYREQLERSFNKEVIISPEEIKCRESFVNEFFWQPDGHCSERTLLKLEEIARKTPS